MAELIFVLPEYGTLYMARRLDAKQAEAFGCPGANLMLTSVKRENSYMVGTLTLTGQKIVKVRGGKFRGTEGIRARFYAPETADLVGYFCEV